MKILRKIALVSSLVMVLQTELPAQQVYTLDDCRQMALSANKEIEQAKQKSIMAGYDKKIALANYFPKISATGTYLHNTRNLSLISEETSQTLSNLGTIVQGQVSSQLEPILAAIMADPEAAQLLMPAINQFSKADVSAALNAIGTGISDAFTLDIKNIYGGIVSIQQPVFVGGKIVASNQLADLAKQLSDTEYAQKCVDAEAQVERDYWQVVSVAAKKNLARHFLDLMTQMEKDAGIAVAEGVAVKSDLLAVKVKKNEAQMMLTKATNGLAMAKMLMAKEIGLPLSSDFTLADENKDFVPEVAHIAKRDISEVLVSRNESRMLDLATKIFDKKVAVQRADYLPKVALTGNYLITNPSLYNGFQNKFGGMFNFGVAVSVPIFHATEGYQRTQKAKAEALLYKIKYQDACNMINLQVEQLYRRQQESLDKLRMTEENLACAEENQRTAQAGFAEGVISSDVALQAQTAYIKAQTEYIDAGIELQLTHSELLRAQGQYNQK